MSSMRNMDISEGDSRRDQAPRVCELAPVHYPRKRRENWPFKFYEERGRMYQNTVPRARKPELTDMEDAPW